jgi:adsorption protein B
VAIALLLFSVSIWLFLSGLDDLFVACAFLRDSIRRRTGQHTPNLEEIRSMRERRIAVFVPLWHESGVIGKMVQHNLSAIRYNKFDFFLGAYPNDYETMEAIRKLEFRFPNVHLALCPHDGPTSKADCLNWIYQRMLLHEETSGAKYAIVVTHDAEDVMHPESLALINFYSRRYDMIQLPVLPLATPFLDFVHGVYCDEFAEYQTKDIPARRILHSFLPSNGVGTGYTRRALELLAQSSANRIFEPECLTEDYENGHRLHQLGCPQFFVPLSFLNGAPVATREYFPRNFRSAVRQRTRWVMGISLQAWERHGWRGNLWEIYWWWRDRKGLVGIPVSTATNLLLAWTLLLGPLDSAAWLLWPALVLMQSAFLAFRMVAVARIYGWAFAAGVPFRTVLSNCINTIAVVLAITRYAAARLRHEPLVWLKTDHSYPTRATLLDLHPVKLH